MKAMVAAVGVTWGLMQWGIQRAGADELEAVYVVQVQLSPESTGRHYGYVLVATPEWRDGAWVLGTYSAIIVRKRSTRALPPLSSGQADKLFSLLATQLAPRMIDAGERRRDDLVVAYRFMNLTPSGAAAYDYWYTKDSWVRTSIPHVGEDGLLGWVFPLYDYP